MKSKKVVAMFLILSVAAVAGYVPFKVNLTMLERLVVGNLLPKETSFATWKIINNLKLELAPTEAELKAIDAKPSPDGGTLANWDAVPEKEITFGEITEKLIVDALKKLDSESKLLPEHLSLYKKFVVRDKKQADEKGNV